MEQLFNDSLAAIVVVAGFLIYSLNEISKARDFKEFTQMQDIVDAAKVAVSMVSAAAVAANKLAHGSWACFWVLTAIMLVILAAFWGYSRYLRIHRPKADANPMPDGGQNPPDGASAARAGSGSGPGTSTGGVGEAVKGQDDAGPHDGDGGARFDLTHLPVDGNA
jgi:hypothetical protein